MANEFKAKNGLITPIVQSTVTTGTAPLVVASTTVVPNLNSDLLDGYQSADFPRKAENATVSGAWTINNDLDINGTLKATAKSFVIQHPTKKNKRLQHGSLEGPEHAVYVRGRGDTATIKFPPYWKGLVDIETVTVQVTPIGPADDNTISVCKITKTGVVLSFRTNPRPYFYFVTATRKDIPPLDIEIAAKK